MSPTFAPISNIVRPFLSFIKLGKKYSLQTLIQDQNYCNHENRRYVEPRTSEVQRFSPKIRKKDDDKFI